jgi:hypothetical protein
MQLSGIVGYIYICDAAIIQKIKEGDKYAACAETCFADSQCFLPRSLS